MVEGRAHMEPWYAMLSATRRVIVRAAQRRIKLSKLQLCGNGPTQKRFQSSLEWWRAALESDISLPLAPRLIFPDYSQSGCALTFQDAARGHGTGLGGFAPLASPDGARKQLAICSAVWPDDLQQALFTNRLSMAAGELFAYVCMATAMHHRFGASHVIGFTDNDPTQAAINQCCSGRPQMQALLLWFYAMCPKLQSLAIWLPGKLNTRSDALSRGVEKAAAVLAEAAAAEWQIAHLPLPPRAFDTLRAIADLPSSE
jgi:hypothetical protein